MLFININRDLQNKRNLLDSNFSLLHSCPKHTRLKPPHLVLIRKIPCYVNCVPVLSAILIIIIFLRKAIYGDLKQEICWWTWILYSSFTTTPLWSYSSPLKEGLWYSGKKQSLKFTNRAVNAYKLLSSLLGKVISSNIKSYPPQPGFLC